MLCLEKALGVDQLGCFIHQMNLVVHDCIFPTTPAQKVKESESNIYEHIQPIITIIEKVKRIVTSFHSSTLLTTALKNEQRKSDPDKKEFILIQDVKTRWNSTFLMLERFYELAPHITVVMISIQTGLPIIDFADIQLIANIISCLRLFKVATDLMSGSK